MAGLSSALVRFLRVTFGSESLPDAPPAAAPKARRGALRLLFAPEELPEDAPLPPRPRARWLAWLFAPERIDPE